MTFLLARGLAGGRESPAGAQGRPDRDGPAEEKPAVAFALGPRREARRSRQPADVRARIQARL